MATRGRKPILKDRKTSCISLENEQVEYLKERGIELSEFIRDQIEALRKSESSPIEQLIIENEADKKTIEEINMRIVQRECRIKELKELNVLKQEDEIQVREFETKKRAYVIEAIKMMQNNTTYKIQWKEYMMEAWKFKTFDEAKMYVRDVWLDQGVPEKRIKSYLRL
jgi:phage terminase small subunit